ncbi:nucleotide exchange factor GrpE [bacterium]|nr:nucleotide exchange factor GrpE [bacterium]
MNPGEGKGEVSLSNEFFKKLNQQIVQKDNLIKLLQLQIKNLKSQVTDSSPQDQQKNELIKALEVKEAEIKNLTSELSGQKSQLSGLLSEKDEQIQALNKALEEHRKSLETQAIEPKEDTRILEFQNLVSKLEGELEQEKEKVGILENKNLTESARNSEDINKLRNELEMSRSIVERAEDLQTQNLALSAEFEKVKAQLQDSHKQIEEIKSSAGAPDSSSRLNELEQDVLTLKSLLNEKDEQINAISSQQRPGQSEDEKRLTSELEALRNRITEWSPKITHYEELKSILPKLQEDAAQVQQLQEKIAALSVDSGNFAKIGMKFADLEIKYRDLKKVFDKQSGELVAATRESDHQREKLQSLSELIEKRETELNEAKSSLDSQLKQSVTNLATKAEFERLTTQVADQLLAIKNFEDRFRDLQDQISAKDSEISALRQRLTFPSSPPVSKVVTVSSDSQIIADFLDFFDGLDSFLAKNAIPELQTLHKKLLERLIVPNQIQYLPAISEEYDPTKHLATDFFLSKKFPEKCIVFEVEKGYGRGDTVIKKPKVWVVQNLFNCHKCDTPQTIPDSRFCYKCGQQILAPNGLPVEKLPIFEPTVATYLKFAERMIDKELIDRAKEFLLEGLSLDQNYVPILLGLADVYSLSFQFPEAIEVLKRASVLKPDPRTIEKMHALEIKNTIYQQARTLPSDEFEKLIVNLRQR